MSESMKELVLKMALKVVENAPAIAVLVYIAWQQQQQINDLIRACIVVSRALP